ncbi:MAG: transketolase [Clostridia bacterium]|nr:transketolase [Clostridia bacterium]
MNKENIMDKNQTIINAIRMLSVDAIQKANSGHPGFPLGAAAEGYTIWKNMKISPSNPNFVDRDRFVLSAGHASMLEYSLLYLFGYGLTMDDIKNFRQLGSLTPGHPEFRHTKGVETTTGPLGQGVANAVGFAFAESILAAKFNREGFPVVDHYTYALCGDGCMQEGIENEAASFAGTNKLGKLIVFYDRNYITIEGNINVTFAEDVGKRHEALGWQVIYVKDGNDVDAMDKAIKEAKAETEKPTLIICDTQIGYGSPLEGSAASHGAPLGDANIKLLREKLGWEYGAFELPEYCATFTNEQIEKGKKAEEDYAKMYQAYKAQYPELATEYEAWLKDEAMDITTIDGIWDFEKADATRNCGNVVINRIEKAIPNLYGGSADLEPANKTKIKSNGFYSFEDRTQRNIHFGIREHAMAAICNGIAAHGGLRPYCATFMVFSDYMRNAMRMSALMGLPVVYVLTHDSIGVGEDGPTHEPIEHLASLRAMPNMRVFRPCDGKETVAAWATALKGDLPCCLALSRQNLPQFENSGKGALKGGYVLEDCEGAPEYIIIATGSEVEIAVNAKKEMDKEGKKVRVVSMPCIELFEEQSEEYKESVLPAAVEKRLAIEAGVSMPWYKYVGAKGKILAIDHFGASAPAKKLFEAFGFTTEKALELLKSL